MNASEANEINLPEHWWAFCTKHNVEYLYYRDLKNGCTYCDKAPAPKPVEPAQVESAPVELYYVQDTRQYCGNSCFWWKPNGNGYTCNLDEAWKVPKEKAESMMRHRPGVDVAWPVASIDSGTARHFDMQNLREMKSL